MINSVQKLLLQLYLDNQQSEKATAKFCFFVKWIFRGAVSTNGALEIMHKTKSKGFAMTDITSSPKVGKGKGSSFLDMLFTEFITACTYCQTSCLHVWSSWWTDRRVQVAVLMSVFARLSAGPRLPSPGWAHQIHEDANMLLLLLKSMLPNNQPARHI